MCWHNSHKDNYGETNNHPNYKRKDTAQMCEYTITHVQYSTITQRKIKKKERSYALVTVLTQPNKNTNTNNKSKKQETPI